MQENLRLFWYPISLSKDLQPGDVVALHLLGDPLCLYRTRRTREAVCVSDRCAHRSAPLSLGQLTQKEDRLECPYHGWQYDTESGRVAKIPAKLEDRPVPANARVYRYPLREEDGLIWIFPGSEEVANEHAIPRILPENEPTVSGMSKSFCSSIDLNIDHSLMVENLLDPAHIPFTHDGTLGRRKDAHPLEMEEITVVDISDIMFPEKKLDNSANQEDSKKKSKVAKKKISKEQECLAWQGYTNLTRNRTRFLFLPPCIVLLRHSFSNGWKFNQTMICLPTRPGHMRLIYMHSRSFLTFLEYLPLMNVYNKVISTKIVFQDYKMLHGQQARLNQGAKAWHSPIQVDGLPKQYRNWLRAALKSKQNENIKQDDYSCRQLDGPWFRGWNCGAKSDQMDIEDIVGEFKPEVADNEWMIPSQRNVDNSAYTWRHERIMNGKDPLIKYDYGQILVRGSLMTIIVGIAAFLGHSLR